MTMLKYASKLTFGASKTDLREDINFTRMREQRAARMKQVLKREGIPAVLVTHEMRGIEREVEAVERDMTDMESAETHIILQLQAIERRLTAIQTSLKESGQPGRISRQRKSDKT